MHELSVALSIVDLACEEGERIGGRVCAVHVRVGALAGVVREALEFSFGIACQDTALEGARLVIDEVPVRVFCHICRAERVLRSAQLLCCAECGTLTPDVRDGRGLELVALEVEE